MRSSLIGVLDRKHLKLRFYLPLFESDYLIVQGSNSAAQSEIGVNHVHLDIQPPDRPFPAPVVDAGGPVNAQEHRGSQCA